MAFHLLPRKIFWRIIYAADSNRAANLGTGDFGTSPVFVQLSDKPLLASIRVCRVTELKAQWPFEKLRVADDEKDQLIIMVACSPR
jgi:hypothetical protein